MKTANALSAIVLCLFLMLAAPAVGQEALADQPDLVLVLSGGGARGFAHIGVLRVLEELEIAPDLIVGTSMGSVVGGLYAAGWSPDEIEHLVRDIDWGSIFTDKIDRRDRSFRRKQDDYPWMIQTRLHFDGFKPVLPSGVIDGQRLELLLGWIESVSPATRDFDDLPIPFRAVAANIATGQAVVLDSGSLATAIRASMSVPGALPPVTIDGVNLVDGGIAANLPIGIALDLGAQRIIAVDISSPLLTDEEDAGSFLSIFTHLNSLLTAGNRERDVELLGGDDVLIVPELGDITFVSFDQAQEAVAIGQQAARLQTEDLEEFRAESEEWTAFNDRSRADPLAPVEVDSVRLDNGSLVDDRLVREALTIAPPEVLDRKGLIKDLLGLYNTRYFGVIGFEMEEKAPGVQELVIHTPERTTGPGSVQFGIGFLDDFEGGDSFHIQARHQLLPANRRAGEWENFIQFGTRSGFSSSYYQPLDWGMKWFVEPSFRYERGTQDIWFDGQAFAQYEFQFLDARVAAGRVLGRWGELRAAAFTGSERGSPRIGSPVFQSITSKRGGGEVSFRVDTEDSVVFPQHGGQVELVYNRSSETLGSDFGFEQFLGRASYAWTFGKSTVFPAVEYSDNLEPAESFFNAFFLGGLFRLSGLGSNELFGEKAVLGRVLAYHRLVDFDLAGARVRIFAGFSLEAGNAYLADESISWGNMVKAGSIFIGGETFIGPVIFAYGRAEGNRDRFYLAIGDRF